jgi:exodeoxyribonuclease VII small subunit
VLDGGIMKKTPGYNEAMQELEAIVEEIENETVDLDLLTEKVKRATYLIKFCRKKLTKTDNDVKKILKEFEADDED